MTNNNKNKLAYNPKIHEASEIHGHNSEPGQWAWSDRRYGSLREENDLQPQFGVLVGRGASRFASRLMALPSESA